MFLPLNVDVLVNEIALTLMFKAEDDREAYPNIFRIWLTIFNLQLNQHISSHVNANYSLFFTVRLLPFHVQVLS